MLCLYACLCNVKLFTFVINERRLVTFLTSWDKLPFSVVKFLTWPWSVTTSDWFFAMLRSLSKILQTITNTLQNHVKKDDQPVRILGLLHLAKTLDLNLQVICVNRCLNIVIRYSKTTHALFIVQVPHNKVTYLTDMVGNEHRFTLLIQTAKKTKSL